ncbi:MAG: hypothetical protein ABJP87_14495, partial [Bauldia litoralis]|uniref:hypothetical protein n=1 Tax=Bauldia litoralis TaxID=665467 RepID=UPI0032988C69
GLIERGIATNLWAWPIFAKKTATRKPRDEAGRRQFRRPAPSRRNGSDKENARRIAPPGTWIKSDQIA